VTADTLGGPQNRPEVVRILEVIDYNQKGALTTLQGNSNQIAHGVRLMGDLGRDPLMPLGAADLE
jgi:hypothetical protein